MAERAAVSWWRRLGLALRLARVAPVAPRRDGDGLALLGTAGTDLDKRWDELSREFADARSAWRNNPLARRLVSLVSSFVCGDGITLTSDRRDLARFLDAFWNRPENRMADVVVRAGGKWRG